MSSSSLQVWPFPADDVVSIRSLSHRIFICGAVIRPQPLVTSTPNGSFKHSSSQTSKPLLTWNWRHSRNDEGRHCGKVFCTISLKQRGHKFLVKQTGERNLILSTHICIPTYIPIYIHIHKYLCTHSYIVCTSTHNCIRITYEHTCVVMHTYLSK
jgi:hypothetical protein